MVTLNTPVSRRNTILAQYARAAKHTPEQLREELGARLRLLMGRHIPVELIWADNEGQAATLQLDGVRFRLRHGSLVVMRPCVECGLGTFESAAIREGQDVAYALAGWEPRCRHCPIEDPANWLEGATF
jgi:hypothetical protein